MAMNIPRRHAIPILYTSGTHYEVGFDMGRNFGSLIKSFIELSDPLQKIYLPLYNTKNGRKVYDDTLNSVKDSFPQYVRELEGIAAGAKVEFHKLFLLHLDEITPISVDKSKCVEKPPVGCSTIIVNKPNCHILGHTEDALSETLNHFYYVVAHIKEAEPQGKYNVKEEHFMSLCYAGHLPGYTMNFNYHGLVFSINTLSAANLRSGKTPRHFLTRALLSAQNFDQAVQILKDSGIGAADGCSINLTFLNEKPQVFYNIEMAPVSDGEEESELNIHEVKEGEHYFHCNKYLRLKTPEINPLMNESSESRMKAFCNNCKQPTSKNDVIDVLSDQSIASNPIFRENGDPEEVVKTIAVGIFDLNEKTLQIYSDKPSTNLSHCKIPLEFVRN